MASTPGTQCLSGISGQPRRCTRSAGRMSAEGPSAGNHAAQELLDRMAQVLAAGKVELPAFPQVVINVQQEFRNPNYKPQTIARLVSSEPALGKKLLDMANSAAFNATGR